MPRQFPRHPRTISQEPQVESSESLKTTDPLHQLRSMKNFPAEVAFQGFGGNLQVMEETRDG